MCGFYGSEVAVSVSRKCGKPFRVSRRIPLASLFEIKKKKERKKERNASLFKDSVSCCDYLSWMLDKCKTLEHLME